LKLSVFQTLSFNFKHFSSFFQVYFEQNDLSNCNLKFKIHLDRSKVKISQGKLLTLLQTMIITHKIYRAIYISSLWLSLPKAQCIDMYIKQLLPLHKQFLTVILEQSMKLTRLRSNNCKQTSYSSVISRHKLQCSKLQSVPLYLVASKLLISI